MTLDKATYHILRSPGFGRWMALIPVVAMFGLTALASEQSKADVLHGYLYGEKTIHYSIEAGPRGYLRRVSCGINSSTCELVRFPFGYRLPDTVHFPIRIKEGGCFCWSLWPAEHVVEPGAFPGSRTSRRSPLPIFLVARRDLADGTKMEVPIEESSTALKGSNVVHRVWNEEVAEDYPISAMYRSRIQDLDVVGGVPHTTQSYPVDPFSEKFAEWAKGQQDDFGNFGSYDTLIDQKGGLKLFLVVEGSDNRRYILPQSKVRRMYELEATASTTRPSPWKWKVVDHYPADFVDRFLVVDSAGERWFIGGHGQLHRLVDKDGAKSIIQQSIGVDRKIELLIEEAGITGRAYAFTAASWFELKSPIVHREFELGELRHESPVPTIQRCAAEVRRHYPALKSERPSSAPGSRLTPEGGH